LLNIGGNLVRAKALRRIGDASVELRAENLGQRLFRGEVVNARLFVVDVLRHGEIVLRQQAMREPADIGKIQRKAEGSSRLTAKSMV